MARHAFKSDTAELKRWLSKRKSSLENARRPMEAIWRDIRLYFEPNIGKALLEGDPDAVAAQRDDEKIVNTSPRILLHRMNAGLQSGITNQSRQWFQLRTIDKKLSETSAVRKWLDDVTEVVNGLMVRSNFYPALDQIYLQLGLGTAAALVLQDDENGIHVRNIDTGAYWIAADRRGRVNVLMERLSMTADQLVAEFGEGWVPDLVNQRIKDGKGEERFETFHYVGPHNADLIPDIVATRPFASVYWIEGTASQDSNDGILAIRSFGYNPIVAPRWSVFGSVYGIGCCHIGLADAKQLQQLEADKLRIVELEVDPPMAAPSSMKGIPIDTGAGGISYYPDTMGKGVPVQRLFETRQNLEAVVLAIQDTENRLKQTFFSDLFAMMINLNMQPKQMTAREVNELSGEKVALLGPILTRLNNDLLNPIVDAVFAIAIDLGLVPEAPPILQGQELRVEYVSSLHVDQAATSRLSGLYRILEFASGIANFNPAIVDKLDTDEMVDIAARALVESGVVRDDKDVEAMRSARAEEQRRAMQAEQQARLVPAMAKAGRDLAETPLGDGTALDAAIAAQGGQQ